MSQKVLRIRFEGRVYSPFSGRLTDGPEGPPPDDRSVLFVHAGAAGSFVYLRDDLEAKLGDAAPEDAELEQVIELLPAGKVLVVEVDAGWNGINTYAFEAAEPEQGD